MNTLEKVAKNMSRLNEKKILKRILQKKSVQKFIIELNTRGQLFNRGEDSLGRSLESIGGAYSANTIEGVAGLYLGKKQKGLPFDRITLFDTGDFYNTFRVFVGEDYFEITADPIKDDDNLFTEWGVEIVGLQEKSKELLIKFIIDDFIQLVKAQIFKGV